MYYLIVPKEREKDDNSVIISHTNYNMDLLIHMGLLILRDCPNFILPSCTSLNGCLCPLFICFPLASFPLICKLV